MKSTVACCYTLLAIYNMVSPSRADRFGSGANQFTIDFVTIGNPGNPADTTGEPNPAGSVDYVYRIGKYEISRAMVEKANAEGDLGISLHLPFVIGGPSPDMQATGGSWNEAARFVNWLNTSERFAPAYNFATPPGGVDYDSNADILVREPMDEGYDADNLFRNSQTHYFLPSDHEWYKAAYYNPDANGGVGGYWDYPTASDSAPVAVSSGTAAESTVWDRLIERGPADILQAGGLGAYGVMGQGGNVWNAMAGLLLHARSSIKSQQSRDFDDDREFTSDDLLVAFAEDGFDVGPVPCQSCRVRVIFGAEMSPILIILAG